jgi:MFS family permease
MLTFGGCLLLGGRLGDLYGHRRCFWPALCCSPWRRWPAGWRTRRLLIAARAVQGLGGAVVSAVALSLIMNLFTEPGERAKAMGVYGFVCAGGGSIGVLLGGLLTSAFSWHWIFLVNLPMGVGGVRTVPACAAARQAGRRRAAAGRGRCRITITASLMLAVYAIVNGNAAGWRSAHAGPAGRGGALLLAAFFTIESRVAAPLMPLGLFCGCATWPSPTWWACCGRRPCLRGSSCRRCTCSWCWATRHAGGPGVFASQPHHGGVLAGAVGKDGDALWHSAAAGWWACCWRRWAWPCLPWRHRAAFRHPRAARHAAAGRWAQALRSTRCCWPPWSDVKPEDSGLASGVVNTAVHDGRRAGPRRAGQPGRCPHPGKATKPWAKVAWKSPSPPRPAVC